MKYYIGKAILVLAIIAWTMWWESNRPAVPWERRNVLVDPKTGCQYIKADEGITARLDKDGKVMCHDSIKE